MSAQRISRRRWFHLLGGLLAAFGWRRAAAADAPAALAARSRVRPGDPGWPSAADWQQLAQRVGPAFFEVRSPLLECVGAGDAPRCAELFGKALKNPYYLGDEPGLAQTLGWVDAWTFRPSTFAVAARTAADVAAAVDFARTHALRLVVKGGGHSYQGTSNAPDSLLVWTRAMNRIDVHERFIADGCEGHAAPVRAVSVGAGAVWAQVYEAVSERAGGYVQGGGCLTVGVAGLIQSGGFGSFSKAFGLAAASLLEAEVVTADGQARIVNACRDPDLFWALKGGGGGSFGIVTRLTLQVHALPETFGAVNFKVRAKSLDAFRRLVGLVVDFCAKALIDPHWGEQIRFRPDDSLQVSMVFQGLTRAQAKAVWQPFFDAVDAAGADFELEASLLKIVSTSARSFWSPTLIKRWLGLIRQDDRPGAPAGNVFWPGDQGQAGQVLHGYGSCWLAAELLQPARRVALVDALFAASRHWGVSLHFNKGLAGAPAEALARARDTAIHPAAIDAFALAISGAEEQPAYPGVPGHEPDVARARTRRDRIARAIAPLRALAAEPGSYLAESDFFEADWQRVFWGANHARLAAVKRRYDPDDLFVVHHGIGSERWSDDGFRRSG